MTVTLEKIKQLRKLTKAGVMDCRQALEEAKGNLEKAKQQLIKKSQKIAQDKAKRETKAGIIGSYVHNDGRVGALVKLSCESDFVSKTKEFLWLAHELAMQVAAMDPQSVKNLLGQEYIRNPKIKISQLILETIGKIKENIKIEEITRLEI